jgi:hypothetical protein
MQGLRGVSHMRTPAREEPKQGLRRVGPLRAQRRRSQLICCLLELNMLCDCVTRGCGDHWSQFKFKVDTMAHIVFTARWGYPFGTALFCAALHVRHGPAP